MGGADVSPGLDGKRQLLPWLRRDLGEKKFGEIMIYLGTLQIS